MRAKRCGSFLWLAAAIAFAVCMLPRAALADGQTATFNETLPSYMQVARFLRREEPFPKTASLKIKRNA